MASLATTPMRSLLKRQLAAGVAAGVAILLMIGLAVWWLISAAATWFAQINPSVSAALVAALAAFGGVLITLRANKEKDVAEAHRAAKVEVYRRFMKFVTTVLSAPKASSGASVPDALGPDFQRDFIDFTSEFAIWAAPPVLLKFAAWRCAVQVGEMPESLLAVDDLLQSIRTDLRHSNRGLQRGDLIRLYLKDPSELERSNVSSSAGVGMTLEDEASLFLSAYGPATKDTSSETEVPRPPLVTRRVVFRPENVCAVFIADAPIGAPPPYRRWKLLGFQNELTDEPIAAEIVAEVLRSRKK